MTEKERFEEIRLKVNNIEEKIKSFENDEKIKKYKELLEIAQELKFKLPIAYAKMKYEEYSSCNHILVISEIDYDPIEGRSYKSHACIKCGLDSSVLNNNYYIDGPLFIDFDYLQENSLYGIHTHIRCNKNLAVAIYSKIKETYPKIDDETAIKFFKVALSDIRNIEVSKEREENRAKRLSLDSSFNKWHGRDVYK